MKVYFTIDPITYFEADADALKEIEELEANGENIGEVHIILDIENKTAEYCWYLPKPGNYLWQEDDFEGVYELWKELGRPVEEEIE